MILELDIILGWLVVELVLIASWLLYVLAKTGAATPVVHRAALPPARARQIRRADRARRADIRPALARARRRP